MTYRVLSLFAGIGGFDLGLERTGGFKTVAFCEINSACRHLLAHHWPEVPCYDDVQTLTADQLRDDGITVDAIVGGFPCQDVSFAGKGAGLAGERSGLWRHYARLIRELRPRRVIVENVAALLGRGLGDVLGDLAALGYDAWWDCIPASAVGAPHRRDRLWLVAYPGSIEHEGYGDALRRAVAAELSRAHPLADAESERQSETGGFRCDESSQWTAGRREVVANGQVRERERERNDEPSSEPCQHQRWIKTGRRPGVGWREWLSEPDVGRVANGVPARVDRLHGLGNAVVPQIPELIGRAILQAEAA